MTASASGIGVIIPCYRQARFLPHALDSVMAQKGVDKQVIVVDDGSPDDVKGVCARYGPAVTYLHQDNAGPEAARNAGIELAEKEFLHFLDADDAIRPGMYAAMVGALRARPEWAAAVCAAWVADADCVPSFVGWGPPPEGCPFEGLARRNLFPVGAVVFRQAVLAGTGLFDTSLKSAEDWDLWLRIARTGAVFGAVVDEPYFVYRTHPAGRSSQVTVMYEAAIEVLRRARRADPRVADPAPEYAEGVSSSDLDEVLAAAAAWALGKAIGSDDQEAALVMLEHLLEHLNGKPHTREQCAAVFNEAATARGAMPPSYPEVSRACWRLLAGLAVETKGDPAASAFLGDLVEFFFGAHEISVWKARYGRLAGTFPVNLALWLRRRLLGIPDPPPGA